MARALYGPRGFYTTGAGPAAHFRTSVNASTVLAEGLAELVRQLDDLLGQPDRLDVVDVGAGEGILLVQLSRELAAHSSLTSRLHLVGVDLAPRPVGLTSAISWQAALPERVVGLVVAHELLDNVPVDVVCRDDGRTRMVLVDERGREQLGDEPSHEVLDWLDRWWPMDEAGPGDRAEVGISRDLVWGDIVSRLQRGVALAVDYGHDLAGRRAGRWSAGTLAAYRDGRQVPIRLDGTCDVTAHVAWDACAAAGRGAGAEHELVLTQREALSRLGVAATRPEHALATSAPQQYLRGLQRLGEVHELMDPRGLGAFTWLLQTRGVTPPFPLQNGQATAVTPAREGQLG
jgi:SAM-dependent MidA family methyltransferase